MNLWTASPAGAGFYAAGLLQVLAAWLFFRRPGVGFWTWAPIWRASRILYPAGVALWVNSSIFMLVGLVLLLCPPNPASCVP